MITAFVIYEQPPAYSPRFVMRKWIISVEVGIVEDKKSRSPWSANTIEELRRIVPDGMNVRPRDAGDPEGLVETWL